MTSYLTRQRLRAADIHIIAPARELRAVIVFTLLYVVAAFGTGLVQRWSHMPLMGATYLTSDVTYLFAFKIGLLLLVPAFATWRAGYVMDDVLLGWRATPGSVFSVVACYVLGMMANASKLAPIALAAAALPSSEAAARIGVGAVVTLFAAALPEELVYRWALQTRLERSSGRLVAILGGALLFTAWHLPTRYLLGSGVEGRAGDLATVLLGTGLPVFVMGLLFGWAWDRWRNLPVLVALHWGIDTLPSVASFLRLPP